MTREARPECACDPFSPARDKFEDMVELLSGTVAATQAEMERSVVEQGTKLMRLLVQGRLDLLFERERVSWMRSPREPGVGVRARARQLETQVGRVVVQRLGIKGPDDKAARFPMDEQLNLPADLYSHPLRERIADEERRGAWEQAVQQIDERTGGHVPKRQAEQLAVRAAQDFDAFYEARPQPANDTLSDGALLMMSSDGKGIRMRPEALRDATRKAAGEAAADVGAGKQQTRKRRKSRKPPPPRPVNKRVWASVEKSETEGIAEMFAEADRRDPERRRTSVVLVDGDESQATAIYDEGRRHNRSVVVVLDIIHMLHYLWLAGFALNGKDPHKTEPGGVVS